MGKHSSTISIDMGYRTGIHEHYSFGQKLGKGGFGTVFAVAHKSSGASYACKILPKICKDPTASDRRRAEQIPSIKREVDILLALKGSLSIATLEDVFEDNDNVYIILELCKGGELLQDTSPNGSKKHSTNSHHRLLSERAVASLIKSVLRTVAQCHSKHILHRDIKPENFMFLTTSPTSPLKAIDFGLATMLPESKLPLTMPMAEGTPWYLAPEACRGKWYYTTDVWACGILAAYMLTGKYPFIDRVTPNMPDLARTLRIICKDELDQSGPEWEALSEEARDFVGTLLVKDPMERPSATAALSHPWLQDDGQKKKREDRPLHKSVVQRLQRFGQNSLFKRTVLEHIAQDLISMHFNQEGDRSHHGSNVFISRSVLTGKALNETSQKGGNHLQRALTSMADRSSTLRNERSSHGYNNNNPSSRGSVRGNDRSFSIKRMLKSPSMAGLPDNPSTAGIAAAAAGAAGADRSVGRSIRFLPIATPFSRRLAIVLDSIDIDADGRVNREDMRTALQKLGYQMDIDEIDELFDTVDVQHKGELSKSDLGAGLMDWKFVQDTYKDRWVESVQKVFDSLDRDHDGSLEAEEIAGALSSQLSDYEVDAAVHAALLEALGDDGADDSNDGDRDGDNEKKIQKKSINFESFLKLLEQSEGGEGDLGLFDDRLSQHSSRQVTTELPVYKKGRGGSGRGCFGCFG
jgi:calcium-dependent protein kinase